MQFLYQDKVTPVRGTTDGRDYDPDIAINFDARDAIVNTFGTYIDQCCYIRQFYSLGFNMASGRQYGPYGTQGPNPFAQAGTAYGFYGYVYRGLLESIGIWTDAPSPPPAPPARPPPPPSPLPVANRTLLNNGRTQTALFGAFRNIEFDDGPWYSGMLPPKIIQARVGIRIGGLLNNRSGCLIACIRHDNTCGPPLSLPPLFVLNLLCKEYMRATPDA